MNKSFLTESIKSIGIDCPTESKDFQNLFDKHISKFNGWLERDEAFFLYELSKFVENNLAIVEIGSYEGKSTVALSAGSNENVFTYAIDPHTGDISEVSAGIEVDTYSNFVSNLSAAGVSNKVIIKRMYSREAAAEYKGPLIGLLFIDGWHTKDAVIADIDSWLPLLDPDGIIIFDDWGDLQVKAGISARELKLPKLLGAVGKDLAFTNSIRIQQSPIGVFGKKTYTRLRILNTLRVIKLAMSKKPT